MIGRIVFDLSVARTVSTADTQPLPSAAWIRFHVVPSAAMVKLGNNDYIDVNEPFTYRVCGQQPTSISVYNEAGSGELVVLYGDTQQELTDFLGSGGGGDEWRTTAILQAEAASGFFNVLDPTTASGNTQGGTIAGITYENDMVNQRIGNLFANGAVVEGYFFRNARPFQSYLNALFAPLGTQRLDGYPSFRIEVDAWWESVNTGEQLFFLGWGQRVVGTETYGVGLMYAPNISPNYHLAVVDYSGGAVGAKPRAADRVVWLDTGIAHTNAYRRYAVEVGVLGGSPYQAVEIDATRVVRSGRWTSYPDLWTNNQIVEAMKVGRTVAGDVGRIHFVEARFLYKLAS